MHTSFADRHVVVTGGTGALGSAVVAVLLELGATVHIPAFSRAAISRFDLADHERVRVVPDVDLTDESATSAFYANLPSLWSSIHLAGGFAMAPLAETSVSTYDSLFDLNMRTCFLCCREAVRAIRATASLDGGRLVNVSAQAALVASGGKAIYAASKAAVAAFTQALGEELAPEGIWVNAVVPSVIDTAANRKAMPKADHSLWPKPAEIAHTIVTLASPENRSVRGGLVPVYGRS